jgi:hypothetical protein
MVNKEDDAREATNPTSVSCEDCGEIFPTPANLESHARSVHALEGSTPASARDPASKPSGGRSDPVEEERGPSGNNERGPNGADASAPLTGEGGNASRGSSDEARNSRGSRADAPAADSPIQSGKVGDRGGITDA